MLNPMHASRRTPLFKHFHSKTPTITHSKRSITHAYYGKNASPSPPPPPAFSTLSSLDGEQVLHMHVACGNCRYPCHLTGLNICESSEILQSWVEEADQKPYGFDTSHQIHHKTGIQIAAVSFGGRTNAQWKSENQDTFFYRQLPNDDTSSPHAPFLIGVIDGHGKNGGIVAHSVREAFIDIIDSEYHSINHSEDHHHYNIPGSNASASDHEEWLSACFARVAQRVDSLDTDLSKSGAAAVVCAVHASRITTAWAGDSRAVLGIHIPSIHTMSSDDTDDDTNSSSNGNTTTTNENNINTTSQTKQKYTRVILPLTRDHKPDPLTCPAETERIIASGGRIDRLATDRHGNPIGPFRIFLPDKWIPGLALSRAFGDTLARSVGVTCIPEVNSIMLPSMDSIDMDSDNDDMDSNSSSSMSMSSGGSNGNQMEHDDDYYYMDDDTTTTMNPFYSSPYNNNTNITTTTNKKIYHVLIVASDGLWEWMDYEIAVKLAWSMPTAQCAAEALAEYARKKWAAMFRGDVCDDITVTVAFIPIV